MCYCPNHAAHYHIFGLEVGVLISDPALGWVIIVPKLFHTHPSPPFEVCVSPNQAADYHTLGLEVGGLDEVRTQKLTTSQIDQAVLQKYLLTRAGNDKVCRLCKTREGNSPWSAVTCATQLFTFTTKQRDSSENTRQGVERCSSSTYSDLIKVN